MTRTCEDQQAAYLEGDPEAIEHAKACPVCGPEREQLDALRSALGEPPMWAEPPAGLEQRIVATALAGAIEERPLAPVVSLADRRAARMRTLRTAVAACAAGIALTIGVGAAIDREPGPDARLTLASTALAPGARAEVALRDTDSGVEVRLDVRGLPRAPAGNYYQAWVNRADGVQVPIGTFHTGSGEVVLWSGVLLGDDSSLTVTLEQEDNDQRSSGRVVLTSAGR